jgi:ATP-dependent DNA helicase RecQ
VNRTRRARVEAPVRTVFGLSALRPGQQAVIDAVLSKQHTLAIMPAGAGKSLCYQVPAMLLPGMTVMISPLIVLLEALDEAVAWAACGTCDNCRGVSIRAEAVAVGAA